MRKIKQQNTSQMYDYCKKIHRKKERKREEKKTNSNRDGIVFGTTYIFVRTVASTLFLFIFFSLFDFRLINENVSCGAIQQQNSNLHTNAKAVITTI